MRNRGRIAGISHAAASGMTLVEIMISATVLVVFVAAGGLLLGSLARQGELNHDLAVVNSEAGNALSLIHAAPFDTIATQLGNDGYTALGDYLYRKILTGGPTYLPQGSIVVTFRDVTAEGGLPDPMYIDVRVDWTSVRAGHQTRNFVTVRTR